MSLRLCVGLLLALLWTACSAGANETAVLSSATGRPVEATMIPAETATMVPPPATETAQPATDDQEPAGSDKANADVLFVRAVQAADETWTFHVTVAHPDTGWDDYADGWDVVMPDGTVLKPDPDSPFTRLLLHPHETEQPFTRSQSRIMIPAGVTQVTVRAHDLIDGFGGQEVVVDLTFPAGENFEIENP